MDINKHNKIMANFFSDYSWLGEKENPPVNFNEYISYLNKKQNTSILLYTVNLLFNVEILEKYKDNLYQITTTTVSGGGFRTTFFFQLSNTEFVVFYPTIHEDKVILISDFHSNKFGSFIKFNEENSEFLVKEKSQGMGFNV